jgi:hypothetical protein
MHSRSILRGIRAPRVSTDARAQPPAFGAECADPPDRSSHRSSAYGPDST